MKSNRISMYFKSKVLLLLITITNPALQSHVVAQDYLDDLRKVKAVYENLDQVEMNMKIAVYAGEESKTPYYNQHAELIKSGNSIYYKVGDTEGVANDEYSWTVDHSVKVIQGAYRLPIEDENLLKTTNEQFEKALERLDQVSYAGKVGNLKRYELTDEDAAISKSALYVDENHKISRLVYHYNESVMGSNSKIVIDFLKFSTNPLIQEHTFSETRFVHKVSEKWVVAVPFQHYQISFEGINQ